jgi:hypothetical protein
MLRSAHLAAALMAASLTAHAHSHEGSHSGSYNHSGGHSHSSSYSHSSYSHSSYSHGGGRKSSGTSHGYGGGFHSHGDHGFRASADGHHTYAPVYHGGKIYRDPAVRAEFAREHPCPNGRGNCVADHIVPLACGGADSVANLQWQTRSEAAAKDKWERIGCRGGHRN